MNVTTRFTSRRKWVTALAVFILVGTRWIAPGLVRAQSSATQLQQGSLVYDGAFRLPVDVDFSYGGGQLAYNPATKTLYVGGYPNTVAEVTVPQPVASADLRDLNIAAMVQGLKDPTEGKLALVQSPANASGVNLGGLIVTGGRLVGTAYIYYDANASQTLTHYTRPLNLSTVGQVGGMYNVGNLANFSGRVSGPMCAVPPEWQAALGGPMITQNFDVPIVSRTSYGPAAYVFDPSQLGAASAPATGLLWYDINNPLNPYNVTSLYWNIAQQQGGCVFPVGTRSLLFVSVHGVGQYCYGEGTADQSLNGTFVPGTNNQVVYCYDPESVYNKGTHAYPYVYQVLAYDANDLAAVKNGARQPWSLRPYARWELSMPTSGSKHVIPPGGVSYDASTQRIFIAQSYVDGASNTPVIHVFHVGSGSGPQAPTNVRIIGG